jgi:hypothetical protein
MRRPGSGGQKVEMDGRVLEKDWVFCIDHRNYIASHFGSKEKGGRVTQKEGPFQKANMNVESIPNRAHGQLMDMWIP